MRVTRISLLIKFRILFKKLRN